ncbi:MAG: photosynthetic complex putative assembly protein PuhB [Panacagrimonas sp.]
MTHEAATTVRELPEALPKGERILWQGAPDWISLYRRAFHGRTLAVYFAIILALRGGNVLMDGGTAMDAITAMSWLLPVALFALAMLALVAWLTARATWYTLTDRRVVMRMGIVLEITFNFPFRVIEAAGLRLHSDGTGDIPLSFIEGEQIAYAHLWPHARPWRFRRTEPMLRCVPQAATVAELLARVMATNTGGTALPIRASALAGTPAVEHPPGDVAAA